MATQPVFNLQGLQLGVQPLLQSQGEFIRLVNVDNSPIGAKTKRPGYITLLDTANGSAVTSLFEWHKDDGTTFFLYRASGTQLYYSTQGTGAWTACGNGGVSAGSPIGYGTLNNTLMIGDGVGSTRHTTDGTSFTDTSLAPVMSRFVDYQGRIYGIGTSSTLFYSTTNDATNWNLSGTSDSSSLIIPGGGKLLDIMKVADRIVTTKNSGIMHRWDGYALVDMATRLGPTSPYAVGEIEDYRFFLNHNGYYGFNGERPQFISHPIDPQINNNSGSAMAGTTFSNAMGIGYKFDYFNSVGTLTDDFTGETISNCLQVYDYHLNQWRNYSTGAYAKSFVRYKDTNQVEQLAFGGTDGQCYQFAGTATSDAGLPIESIMEFIYHDGLPHLEKEFNYIWLFFNPGCQAHVQVAVSNSYTRAGKIWVDLGDVSSGVAEYHFSNERGRLLFVKITENSTSSPFTFYGYAVDYDPIDRK